MATSNELLRHTHSLTPGEVFQPDTNTTSSNLPMRGGPYAKLVASGMPFALQGVMTAHEYDTQTDDINRLLERTSASYVHFISTAQKFLTVALIALSISSGLCFFLFFLSKTLAVALMFVILGGGMTSIIVLNFVAQSITTKKKKNGDEQSRAGLAAISEKWRCRGISWRLKEGEEEAISMFLIPFKGMGVAKIRPLLVVVQVTSNATSLFRSTVAMPSTPAKELHDHQAHEKDSLLPISGEAYV